MKNRKYTTSLLALCAGVIWLSACTKDDTVGLSDYSNTQITPQAQVSVLGIEQEPGFESGAAQAQSQTRAAANPAQTMTLYLVRANETGVGTGTYGAYSTTPISVTRAAGAGAQALAFATPQYYIANNARSRLTGWYPAAATFAGGVASWTLDGTVDILTAAAQEGNIETPLPPLAFEHRLSKLQFEVVAKDANIAASWGTISAVNVLAQPTTCKYTPVTNAATGAVATSGSTTYNVKNFASGALTTTATARGDAMFVAPSATNVSLSLTVVSSTRGTVTVTVPARSYEAGKAYKLTLSFTDIKVAATVVPWKNVTTDDQVGKLKVGMVADGGIVYWIDPADATKYKVFSLDQGNLAWAAKNPYVTGSAGQSDTDGKANVAAMKAYFAANEATVGTDFSVAFPAAEFCDRKNTGGITGWYLPAVDELVALSTAYKANQTVLSAAITASSGTDFPASALFWSSTEVSFSAYNAMVVTFSDGNKHTSAKNAPYRVRCIREITPPAIGDVKDGGIVYEVNGANYKVFSLDQGSNLTWAAKRSYVLGAPGQSTTDGKANVAAMKAYFAANTATVGADFSVAFPAAEFCDRKNTGGVTGWYLPAVDELVALSKAYNDNTTVLKAAITANQGTTFPANDYFWSSTEHGASYAWYVGSLSSGAGNGHFKDTGSYVRCVRAN